MQLVDGLDLGDALVREFHGTADNGNLAGPCRDYFARLSAAGRDAAMSEYPAAFHGFDNPGQFERSESPGEQTTRDCRLHEDNGRIVNNDTGATFTYADACVTRGYTQLYDPATKAARAAVRELLGGLFRLN